MLEQKRAWLYGRVAHDDGLTLVIQMDFLRHWAEEHGYTIVGETAETGNGLRPDRPGLSAVMQAIRQKRMDTVIIKDLGRLIRRYADLLQCAELLQANDVSLVTADDSAVDFTAMRFWA